MRELLERTRVNEAVVSCQLSVAGEESPISALLKEARASGSTIAQLLKRPEVQIEQLAPNACQVNAGIFRSKGGGQLSAVSHQRDRDVDDRQPTTDNSALERGHAQRAEVVETEIKYSGYLDQQTKAIERLKRSEQRLIPELVRLWQSFGSISRNEREADASAPADPGAGQPHSWGHARRGRADQRVYRNPGATDAGCLYHCPPAVASRRTGN